MVIGSGSYRGGGITGLVGIVGASSAGPRPNALRPYKVGAPLVGALASAMPTGKAGARPAPTKPSGRHERPEEK